MALTSGLLAFGTHVPVVTTAIEVFRAKNLLEYGCGYISNVLFSSLGLEKYRAFDDNPVWVEEIRNYFTKYKPDSGLELLYREDSFSHKPGLQYKFTELPYTIQGACWQTALMWALEDSKDQEWEVLFVDGNTHMRYPVTQTYMTVATKCIIMHDSETPDLYAYNRLMIPSDWYDIEFVGLNPATRVLIHESQEHRIDHFKKQVAKKCQKDWTTPLKDWHPWGPPELEEPPEAYKTLPETMHNDAETCVEPRSQPEGTEPAEKETSLADTAYDNEMKEARKLLGLE